MPKERYRLYHAEKARGGMALTMTAGSAIVSRDSPAAFGNLHHPVEHVLGVYFHQCAVSMNCVQLAKAGLYLAARGTNPLTGHSVVSPKRARRINALMLTCGHYDGSGDFAYRVGLPGKSGVGGGILAVAPGIASIAVWSPGLNKVGNSLLGSAALDLTSAFRSRFRTQFVVNLESLYGERWVIP